ncbi:ATPase subunit of ABC transporter with duplicated ATPase domains [Kerstersia gyiorum]|uniref:ATPase subunit of ABC transporter with duplicated ATPase domains n=1 Tax=Kerstersia gyiorum TaxID=206506 RepID=A0A4Q7MKE7_9BURK|nr:ABC-F family ATP-binding cassette domain-containing protein [Kerstersia gyiorum]KAB0541629.1 ABC-F family ATP-binding cassette domain-containing protein [Kerstersia gyiorum]RZS67232.1 ATPase subunit of ABC transporter with duplicated ATPase domains [Kerstersia gyiorum]
MTSPCTHSYTGPYLALEGVSYVLPDGRTLFSGLSEHFDRRATGLVGRNGIGKSVLARLLSGQLQPSAGRCVMSGKVHYLAQQLLPAPEATVAGLTGVQARLDALARIEAGSSATADFEILGDAWDIRQRLHDELARSGLGYLDETVAVSRLSGGEAMRLALIGAMLSEADFLVLDEPTNHLDGHTRQVLLEQLQRWPRGLLVLSHDRRLLDTMDRIVELSSLGVRSYGGNYTFYAQCKARERENAIERLEQRKLERQRDEQMLREQRERQEKRQARGNRQGREANQAKILLDRQKERSQGSAGKLRRWQAEASELAARRVIEAAREVAEEAEIVMHAPVGASHAPRCVATLEEVVLPYVQGAAGRLSLQVAGQQRIGVVGPNGCGKSTLLKVLAGLLAPVAGRCHVSVPAVYLDQGLADLAPERSVLVQMRELNRSLPEGELRMRLAHLGLDAQAVIRPSGRLSGGERLKAALARVMYADVPPQLLLLDEPNNHLDLPSIQALESLLQAYAGALVVVSHDEAFLDQLGLTDRLLATGQGWHLQAW